MLPATYNSYCWAQTSDRAFQLTLQYTSQAPTAYTYYNFSYAVVERHIQTLSKILHMFNDNLILHALISISVSHSHNCITCFTQKPFPKSASYPHFTLPAAQFPAFFLEFLSDCIPHQTYNYLFSPTALTLWTTVFSRVLFYALLGCSL